MAVLPSEALVPDRSALGLDADVPHLDRAVALPEGVAAGDERDDGQVIVIARALPELRQIEAVMSGSGGVLLLDDGDGCGRETEGRARR